MNPEETRDFESEINECIKEPEFDISKRSEQEGKLALAIFKKAYWRENNYEGLIDTISDFVFDKKYTQKMTENAITFIKLIDVIINERISDWLNYIQ